MKGTPDGVLEYIRNHKVEMVDVKFIDLPGMWHHFTVPAEGITETTFTEGLPFDSSSLQGYKSIELGDMLLVPDPGTAVRDPFMAAPTLSIICDMKDPLTGRRYLRDPRHIAQEAERYLARTGIADESLWGPEPEFFIFDAVKYDQRQNAGYFFIESEEAHWDGHHLSPGPGYKIKGKGGYVPVPPKDSQQDLRTEMVQVLQACGFKVERHHHEVATGGQAEINYSPATLTRAADMLMLFKYVIKNAAWRRGKTATFMPKPLFGDNGSGLHVHLSLQKGGEPLFYDPAGYGNLSQTALYYIGGLLYHAPALLAFTNPSVNSYKRLVPGFEAPVNLAFARGNRSAAVRLPLTATTPGATRIEFRTPDSTCNPYLAFAAMLLAGLDGIKNQIDPVAAGYGPVEENIYQLPAARLEEIQQVPASLEEALEALEQDHDFLLQGGVFTVDLIETWIKYKYDWEIVPLGTRPHPYEFYLYYDL